MNLSPAPGAYVHVPYCAHRCTYCSFVALEGLAGEAGYFAALGKEIAARAGETEGPLDTVYFGGGTPSFVPPERLAGVLAALRASFEVAPDAEITAEANPDDLVPERLEALRALGVNRLSVGVQSLSDPELVPLERRHDAAAARAALRSAAALFPSVSGDLMIGIPGQTRESLRASLEGLLEAGAAHVSVYLLEIEKAPKLVAMKRERPELFADEEEMAARWEEVDALCAAAGLPRYEVSNWARPGRESRHNLKYWTLAETPGFGVAAHSYTGGARRANTGSSAEYVARVNAAGTAFVSETRLDPPDALRERVLLLLRLAAGALETDWEAALATLGAEDRERLREREEAGLLERVAGRIRLTRRGVLLSNEVFAFLL